jgi:hypothetical protein
MTASVVMTSIPARRSHRPYPGGTAARLGRLGPTVVAAALALAMLTAETNATGPDDCAVVLKTPDGFLNVRKAPAMKSEIIAKIHPGDLVYADAYECRFTADCEIDTWTHIDSVLRSSGEDKPQPLRGWVATRFLKTIQLGACFWRKSG